MPHFGPHFRFSWPALLAVTALVASGAGLGLWQLDRAAQKQERLRQIAERGQQSPRTVDQLLDLQAPAHYPVRVRGRFDNRHHFLLDNRILEGRAGYHVLTPLHTLEGHWVLVNRGWIERGTHRDVLPEVPDIPGMVTVHGRSYVPSDRVMVLKEEQLSNQDWPVRIQRVDLQALEGVLGVELAPFEIRVAPDAKLEAGQQWPRVWHDSRLGPERHHAYAAQWFALAAAALIFFLVLGYRHRPPDNGRSR